MDEVTRRTLLAATAAGGIFAAATTAGAQPSESVPQPQRPGHGGTDPGPRNLARDSQNRDLLVPPPPIRARFLICASLSRTLIRG